MERVAKVKIGKIFVGGAGLIRGAVGEAGGGKWRSDKFVNLSILLIWEVWCVNLGKIIVVVLR
jgi:hypothetical protein